jgi:hypothetical protein
VCRLMIACVHVCLFFFVHFFSTFCCSLRTSSFYHQATEGPAGLRRVDFRRGVAPELAWGRAQ